MLQVKDRVTIHQIGTGWIAKIYRDCDGGNISVVMLEDASATPNGFYLARDCEMQCTLVARSRPMTARRACSICGCIPCESPGGCASEAAWENREEEQELREGE